MPKLNLPRDVLAKIAQGNPLAIKQLERVLGDVGDVLPSTIEEANALAGQALAAAQLALSMLAVLAETLAQLDGAPAPTPVVEADDHAPRPHAGTVSTQDHDSIEITGGTVDGTLIGTTTAAAGKFTTLAASEQITSSVPDGIAPLVVGSTTKVDNLYVARAALADNATNATNAGHATSADNLGTPGSYPADATDLPTVIALANFIKAQNTLKGI